MGVAQIFFDAGTDERSYSFRGARGNVVWSKERHRLTPGGVWNVYWRAGCVVNAPSQISSDRQSRGGPDFLALTGSDLTPEAAAVVAAAKDGDRLLVVSGSVAAIASVAAVNRVMLPWSSGVARRMRCDATLEMHAPDGADVFSVDEAANWETLGQLFSVGGERQTPERASIHAIDGAPVALRHNGLIVLNGDPFGAHQGWLQGHDDLSAWLSWRNRLHWLDENALALTKLLDEVDISLFSGLPRLALEVPERVLVLRHDLDNSRDETFLNAELMHGVPATHAILDDRNADFWIERLSQCPPHELAFHYDTARAVSFIDRLTAKVTGRPVPIRGERGRIAAGGLSRQIARVRRRHGLAPSTLHRHLSFLYYPEWIDALDSAASDSGIVAASSYFRGRVVRFGDPLDSSTVSGVDTPDVQFPTWYPWRPWHVSEGRLCLAYEATTLIEPSPDLLLQVMNYDAFPSAPRVVLACYHPAHANTDTITPGGSAAWLQQILDEAEKRSWRFSTFSDVANHLKDVENRRPEAACDAPPPKGDSRAPSAQVLMKSKVSP